MGYKISIIGAGNMATSILGGMIKRGYSPQLITASSPDNTKLELLRERYGIHISTDNNVAVKKSDVVVLAVKPQVMRDVCSKIRDAIQLRKPLILSIAAGLKAETLEGWLGGRLAMIRCMPNTSSLVGIGASGLYANSHVNDMQRDVATRLLSAVGLVEWVEQEDLLNSVTAVSGSGPAYFFLIFEAMEDAGVKMGLHRESARRLVLQTALGASSMALASSLEPSQLKLNVMSPQGTTERAINVFEGAELRKIFSTAMQACADRAREMSKEFGRL